MSDSVTLKCSPRQHVGSRDSRRLRAQGRIPVSLQGERDHPNLNLHLSEEEFLATRRHHVHLYDLDIEGTVESAVVRELQWTALGDRIAHIEFKRVQRGVETESEVDLDFHGVVKDGVLNHNVTEILVRCLPSHIPDSIRVNVEGMPSGTHIHARDLVLPEGVSLAIDPDVEIAVVTAVRAAMVEKPAVFGDEGEEEGAAPPPAAPAPEEP